MSNINSIKKSIFYLSFPLTFVSLVYPIKAIEYGASSFQLGTIFAILSLVSIVVNPIIGSFIDKKGCKTSLICGSLIYVGALVLLHFCNSYVQLLLTSLISGFSASFIGIASDTYILSISSENEVSENFARVQQWGARGGFIGVFIGFTVMFTSFFDGFRPVFLILSVFMLISIFYTIKNLPNNVEKNEEETKKSFFQFKGFKNLNGVMKFFLVIIFMFSIDGGLLSPVFLSYVKDNVTANLYNVSNLYIPAAILSMILPVQLCKLVNKYNKMNIIIASLIVNILCWVYFITITDFNMLTALFTFMSLVGTTSGLAWSSIKKSIFSNDQIGYKSGLSKLVSGLGAAIGALLGGWLYNYNGISVVIGFKVSISIGIVILCLIFFKSNLFYGCSEVERVEL